MRKAGAMSVLALGAGSLAFGQDASSQAQKIAELQKQVDAMQAQLRSLQTETPSGSLEARLDGAVRNSPVEALREPRRLNISAPGLDGLDINGLVHIRGDYWANFDSGGGNNDVSSFGTEAQLGFDARVSEKTSVRIGLHYSDIWGNDTNHGLGGTSRLTDDSTSSADGDITAFEANLRVGDLYGTGVDMIAGRQRIELGAERIIGDDEWRLTRTSFDGFRFDNNLGDAAGRWTLLALRLHDSDNSGNRELLPIAPSAPNNNPINNADLYGFYYTVMPRDIGTIDAYFFHLEDFNYPAGMERTRFSTYGARWASPDWEGLSFEAEGATQFGELFGNKTDNYGFGTYALHGSAAFRPRDVEYFDGIHAAYDYATGGNSPEENFQQLFPSLHGWFGLTDMFGWSNIQHTTLGASFDLGEGQLNLGYHWSRRATTSAGFGGYNLSSASSGGNKPLGQEIDLTYVMECSKSTTVGMGIGYFFAGNGYHDLTGNSDNMMFGYFAATTRF